MKVTLIAIFITYIFWKNCMMCKAFGYDQFVLIREAELAVKDLYNELKGVLKKWETLSNV